MEYRNLTFAERMRGHVRPEIAAIFEHSGPVGKGVESKKIGYQGPVSLRLMTSRFKDIVTHTQK